MDRPSLEELRGLQYREPVILRGLLEQSGLLKELRSAKTLDDKLAVLDAQLGDRKHVFNVRPPESGGHYLPSLVPVVDFDNDAEVVPDEVPFAEFARRLKAAPESGEYVYMQDGVVEQDRIRGSLRFDFLQGTNPRGVRSKFWIGSDGQVFNLHYDDFVNYICMFEGTKRVTMFPPEQLPNMYHAAFDVMCGYAPTTHVQLLKADLGRFPKFRTALEHACVAVLEPGDALLIPPFWWHHVESFTPLHVMVNNFIMTIPFSVSLEFWKSLSEGIRTLARATPAERQQERERFHRAVIENAGVEAGSPLLEQARRTAAALTPSWRKHMVRLWDAFAFQVHGDPFPASPGGLEGLLERQAGQPTLYPNANVLTVVPELLEMPQGDAEPG
ncbi:cupin-like domain-containing protein [Pyxidicoccus xibeiensis]|uniref:cupin-like domain-containing protein n=1 Tax=Pyxidicoccus xibeiensis TaxID=2906759 RepID=UPI0020A7176C|nr:cupin-like domain-containing protein [Pyxidicoccus xibeiensis]MCP3138684.1 cupin-like domain-containing protein [Pyxidicoccus xibeiensis]